MFKNGFTGMVLGLSVLLMAWMGTAEASIISFSFDARAYGVDQTFATTAGNVSVSGSYDNTITDSGGRFLMKSFSWSGDSQLQASGYTCADMASCSSNSADFYWYDSALGAPFMELHDGSYYFRYGSGAGNIYSFGNPNGSWNVADIVNFTFTGTATGVNHAFNPVSGGVSGSGSYDAGTSDSSGLHPLVSLSWSGDPALEAPDYVCAELATCADNLDDTVAPDILLFDPLLNRPYFRLHDGSYFLSYGVTVGNIYSPSAANGTWEITALSRNDNLMGIPEPTTLTIFALGLAGLGFMRRRDKAQGCQRQPDFST